MSSDAAREWLVVEGYVLGIPGRRRRMVVARKALRAALEAARKERNVPELCGLFHGGFCVRDAFHGGDHETRDTYADAGVREERERMMGIVFDLIKEAKMPGDAAFRLRDALKRAGGGS